MFVRFRALRRRLQASLIETRRAAGTVRHEHIASLGAVDAGLSVADRVAFWQQLGPGSTGSPTASMPPPRASCSTSSTHESRW
jgi:hypothetical protein